MNVPESPSKSQKVQKSSPVGSHLPAETSRRAETSNAQNGALPSRQVMLYTPEVLNV